MLPYKLELNMSDSDYIALRATGYTELLVYKPLQSSRIQIDVSSYTFYPWIKQSILPVMNFEFPDSSLMDIQYGSGYETLGSRSCEKNYVYMISQGKLVNIAKVTRLHPEIEQFYAMNMADAEWPATVALAQEYSINDLLYPVSTISKYTLGRNQLVELEYTDNVCMCLCKPRGAYGDYKPGLLIPFDKDNTTFKVKYDTTTENLVIDDTQSPPPAPIDPVPDPDPIDPGVNPDEGAETV